MSWYTRLHMIIGSLIFGQYAYTMIHFISRNPRYPRPSSGSVLGD